MENHVKVLKELFLGEFSTIKFFKKIGYRFSQKAQARDSLQKALKTIASNDDEYSWKAKSLLDTFDEHMDSYTVELYWDGLKVQNERDKTLTDQLLLKEKKEQHLCLIDSNVITEHNQSSNILTLESSESDVSATSKQNRYTLRRKRSLDIDEEQIMKKVNCGDDTTPCPRSPDLYLPRNNSGNDEPVDIIVISDDEATDDEATDDKAKDYRISFNFDELERQLGIESKDQIRFDDNVANTFSKGTSSEKVESDHEGLALLFDELSEDALMESIDEKLLEQENKLPQASGNSSSKVRQKIMDANIIESFHKYENKIPKARKIFTPAYWGVMDLTKESLFDCKQLTDNDITQLSEDFANKISWRTVPQKRIFKNFLIITVRKG
ncbi:hypothetical protein C1645_792432 [Glomus cerebriforme]|uniref:Uncharacterized protein n=1 Tax=Glomus cerebriforme TaxID=658196 RepID=A0A397S719_9GLOM|nr:hypothetical protein C1645_792432 [Glomus cerebriforme]